MLNRRLGGASVKSANGRFQSEQSWRQLYLAALFELDPDRLPQRIADAEQSIGERALALARTDGDKQSEQKALGNAHLALDELKRIHQVDRRVA
jgi:hypothetical protein